MEFKCNSVNRRTENHRAFLSKLSRTCFSTFTLIDKLAWRADTNADWLLTSLVKWPRTHFLNSFMWKGCRTSIMWRARVKQGNGNEKVKLSFIINFHIESKCFNWNNVSEWRKIVSINIFRLSLFALQRDFIAGNFWNIEVCPLHLVRK